MKNKIYLVLCCAFIFILAGFLFSKSDLVILVTFIPGLIATLISQTVFGTRGGESLIIIPEVLIVNLIFWLILPWILLILLKRAKDESKELILISVIATSFWPIGVALNSNFSRFLLEASSNLRMAYFVGISLLIFSALALIWKIYEDRK
ncbi:MAG: hypothetical protein AABX23_04420 [Nanoarchaeota archaeon]